MTSTHRISPDILDTIARAPLIRLNRVTAGLATKVALEAAFFNPLGSVKDRIGCSTGERYLSTALAEDTGLEARG